MDYKTLYFDLFSKVTDTIDELKKVQQDAEEKYLQMTSEKKEE